MYQNPDDRLSVDANKDGNQKETVSVNKADGQNSVLNLDDGLSCPIRTSVTFKKHSSADLTPTKFMLILTNNLRITTIPAKCMPVGLKS